MTPPVDSGPNLLLDWHEPAQSTRWMRAGVGSVVAHLVIVSLLTFLVSLDTAGSLRNRKWFGYIGPLLR